MQRKYYELIVNLFVKQDIHRTDCGEKLSKLINFSMEKDKYLKEIHIKKNSFKGYSFSHLYPIEQDGIYKQNDIYRIMIRTYDKKMVDAFKEALIKTETEEFAVVGIDIKIYTHRKIDKLFNIAPAVATIRDKNNKSISWSANNYSDDIVNDAIWNNLIKKYKYFNNLDSNIEKNDVISYTKRRNDVAMIINYKGIKLLGYKFEVGIKDNMLAQDIGNFASVLGILEKGSSLGTGFVKANYIR